MKTAESPPNRWKTLWEKEILLFMSNVFFSCSVFRRLILQTHKKQGLFWKGLKILSPNIFNNCPMQTYKQASSLENNYEHKITFIIMESVVIRRSTGVSFILLASSATSLSSVCRTFVIEPTATGDELPMAVTIRLMMPNSASRTTPKYTTPCRNMKRHSRPIPGLLKSRVLL